MASRRASEALITEGRITVNGREVRELGTKIDPAHDRVTFDGAPVRPKQKLYLAVHKPPGYVCSRQDATRRPLISDLLPKEWGHLYSVGRLDCYSEGLIFLTNDGDFSLRLTHPRYGIRKKYIVTIEGHATRETTARIIEGVVDKDEKLKAEKARILAANQSHSVLELEMAEGKYREVRRIFEVLGFVVDRLQRVQIGPIKLGDLPAGKWRTLSAAERKSFWPDRPPRPATKPPQH